MFNTYQENTYSYSIRRQPWSRGQSNGLRSGRSAVRISARAKDFYQLIVSFIQFSYLQEREKARPHELTRRSGRAKDDAEECRHAPMWYKKRDLEEGMDVQKEQAQLEESSLNVNKAAGQERWREKNKLYS